MGGCISSKQSHKTIYYDCYYKEPQDTQKFSNEPLPKLMFHAMLANVKIKQCRYNEISIRFTLEEVEQFLLAPKKIFPDGSVKWKIQHKIGFQMNQYQLRKRFLKLAFLDNNDNIVADIKINLYLLCTGPYHQDFQIEFKNKKCGRINFDFKVSQIIQLRLQSTNAQVELTTNHPGQKFNFSIKTIVDHHNFQSSLSYKVCIRLDNNQKLQQFQLPTLKKKKTLKYAQKQIQQGKNLVWTKQNSLNLPSLVFNMQAFELHHGCFQILIWKIDDFSHNEDFQQKPQLYAQCYISLQKLFLADCKTVKENLKEFEIRQIDVNEKLWSHGKQIGIGHFKFNVRIQKYIKQMQVCIRTQQGILNTSPVFTVSTSQQNKNQSKCNQLSELLQIIQEIQGNVIVLQKAHDNMSSQSRVIRKNIQKSLRKMLPILEKSYKQSVTIYNYSSEKQLIKGQKILLTIGFKLFEYVQQEDPIINQLCILLLIALLRRSQFILCYIGFNDKDKEFIKKNQIHSVLRSKIENALMYQQFIYKMLGLALKNLNIKGLQYQRSFAQIFCAYAYFRIPEFRNQLLLCITRDDDPQIIEWRGIEFNLNEDIDYQNIKQDVNTFTILFDWTNSFHKCLEKQQKYQTNLTELNDILLGQEWRQRMQKRGTAFFLFVKYWVNYVQSIAVKTRDVQWKYFPGYNRIIRSFLVQMKKRSIVEYPDALKITCCHLLANQKLLNTFVAILLNKSNINESLTILKGIHMIGMLLDFLTEKKRKISQTFNYIQFSKAIKIILESQFSYGIAQILSLLYTHYQLFHIEFKKSLSMFLLGKVFFKLFLHWSYNVRLVFYYIITIRIYSQSYILHNQNYDVKSRHKFNEDVKLRYERLLIMIESQNKLQNQNLRNNILIAYQKEFYKKMKKKIYKITNQKLSNANSQNYSFKVNSDVNVKTVQLDLFKYSIQKEESIRMQRTNSQVLIKTNFILSPKNNLKNTKQQVVKLTKRSSFNFQQEVRDAVEGKPLYKKSNIIMFDESDTEIVPIAESQLAYLQIGLKQFNQVNETLKKYISKGKIQDIPLVKMQMPIDGKQLRPDKIDDW